MYPYTDLYLSVSDTKFKCGEDDDGDKIRIKLKHFAAYMHHQRDDSPLYIFDGNFDGDKVRQNGWWRRGERNTHCCMWCFMRVTQVQAFMAAHS